MSKRTKTGTVAEATEAPILEDKIKTSMFDSLNDERAFHERKAEQFKNRLNNQVSEIKDNAKEYGRKGAIIGGAVLGATILVRLISGTKKKWVDTPEGAVKVKTKESFLWSLTKGAALVGLGYLAKDRVIETIDRTLSQPDDYSDSDPTSADQYASL